MIYLKYISITSVRLLQICICLLILHSTVSAQVTQGDVRVEIDLMPSLTKAQTLSLSTLGVDTQGAGNRLMNLVIENTTGNELTNLYLHINVTVSGMGTIAELDQIHRRPFSLRPAQIIIASNNDLQEGLPGVTENIQFQSDLTSEGEEFINQLEGSATLPDRVYTIELRIYHGNNRLNGGNIIAESMVTLPVEEMFTDVGFDLERPGNVVGAPLERVVSTRPVFRWQGSATQTYRLVIVEAKEGQSAQGLIQAALDTEPIIGASNSGDLLEFEMVDAAVTGTNFTYPITRAQDLQHGTRYYWQVFASVNSPSGTELQPSPIWQFGIQRSGSALSEIDEEVLDMISNFLPERYMNLMLEGYSVENIEINGQTVSGPQMILEMEQFINDLEEGSIQIVE